MVDATKNRTVFKENITPDAQEFIVKSAEVMAVKRYGGIDISTGFLENAKNAAGIMNFGIESQNSKGQDTEVTGDGSTVEWTVRSNFVDEDVTVAGIGSKADIHKPVYASDNQTLTIVRPAIGSPIGILSDWKSGTTGNVLLFSRLIAVILGYQGGTVKREKFIVTSKALEAGVSAISLFTATNSGRLVSAYAILVADDSGVAAGDQTIGFDIGGVNVTGGQIQLLAADTIATKIAGTAITALNTFKGGQDINLEIQTSTTPFSADQQSMYEVNLEIEYLPGG